MSNNITPQITKTLSDLIRQSFFLKEDFTVTQKLAELYSQCLITQNFEPLIPFLSHNHTDTFTVYTTHDIDWLNPHHPYSVAKYVRSKFTSHAWLTAKQMWHKDSLLKNIEQLLMLENELDIKATYCLGATNGWQFARHAIRYANNSSLVAEMISLITLNNQSIGLHSSYNASKNNWLQNELTTLQNIIPQKITAHRSHYLNSNPNQLYHQLEKIGIKYELGNGAARSVGLTNGLPGKYKPLLPSNNTVMGLTIIPLVLMDNVFFIKPYHQVMAELKKTLHTVKQYNGSVCILFHPENNLLKPQLYNYFEEIIHICKQEGANLRQLLT